jgi:hypothetical protein
MLIWPRSEEGTVYKWLLSGALAAALGVVSLRSMADPSDTSPSPQEEPEKSHSKPASGHLETIVVNADALKRQHPAPAAPIDGAFGPGRKLCSILPAP